MKGNLIAAAAAGADEAAEARTGTDSLPLLPNGTRMNHDRILFSPNYHHLNVIIIKNRFPTAPGLLVDFN